MIVIKKNPNGDTRTAQKNVSFDQFQEANASHRNDVFNVMYRFASLMEAAAANHDITKKLQERMFYRDFLATMNDEADFTKSEWYQLHVKAERHHLLSHCPEDVNLIDVLEMLADCVCAGLARNGNVRNIELNDDILRKAVENTIDLIKSMIIVEEDK